MWNDALSGFLGAYGQSSAARVAADNAAEDRAAEVEARTRRMMAERLAAVQALGEARLQAGDRTGAEALGAEAIRLQNKVFGLNLTGNQIHGTTEQGPGGPRRVISPGQDPMLRANLGLQQPKPVPMEPGRYMVDPMTGRPMSYLQEQLSPNVAAQISANQQLSREKIKADERSDASRYNTQMAITGVEVGSRERIAELEIAARAAAQSQRQPSLRPRTQGGFIIYADPATGRDVGYKPSGARFDAEAFRRNWLAQNGYDPRVGSFVLQGDGPDAKAFRAALQAEQSRWSSPPPGLSEITSPGGQAPQQGGSIFRALDERMRRDPRNPAAQGAGAAGTQMPGGWRGQVVRTSIGTSYLPSSVSRSTVEDFRSLPSLLRANYGVQANWSVRSEAAQQRLNAAMGRSTVNSWHGHGKALDIPVSHPMVKARIISFLLGMGYGVIDEGDHLHASPDGR